VDPRNFCYNEFSRYVGGTYSVLLRLQRALILIARTEVLATNSRSVPRLADANLERGMGAILNPL